MVLRPPELNLSADVFGREGSSPEMMLGTERIKKNISLLRKNYLSSTQGISYREWYQDHGEAGRAQLSLTPTLFWYDNVHVVETKHYRDFVYDPKFKMVAKGGFVEDKLSPVLIRSVERLGLIHGHRPFGCYLLDDHSGMFFTGHLDGGSYLTKQQRETIIRENTRTSRT